MRVRGIGLRLANGFTLLRIGEMDKVANNKTTARVPASLPRSTVVSDGDNSVESSRLVPDAILNSNWYFRRYANAKEELEARAARKNAGEVTTK